MMSESGKSAGQQLENFGSVSPVSHMWARSTLLRACVCTPMLSVRLFRTRCCCFGFPARKDVGKKVGCRPPHHQATEITLHAGSLFGDLLGR